MAEETGTWTVRWTLHALTSLAERRIPRVTADAALQEPERIEVGRGTREVWMKRYQDDGLGRPMLLRIVVERIGQDIVVITAYKTSRIDKYLPEPCP